MERSVSINAVDHPVEYLNGSVWVKLAPSNIHGVGVFAIRDIPKDTLITDNSRHDRYPAYVYELKQHDFKKLIKPIRDLILDRTMFSAAVYLMQFISPNSECYLQDFCNHSDTPNVDTDFVSLRDIKEGEEILENYRDFKIQGGKAHPLVVNHLKDICL